MLLNLSPQVRISPFIQTKIPSSMSNKTWFFSTLFLTPNARKYPRVHATLGCFPFCDQPLFFDSLSSYILVVHRFLVSVLLEHLLCTD